jgi:hypothetical protein
MMEDDVRWVCVGGGDRVDRAQIPYGAKSAILYLNFEISQNRFRKLPI